MQSPLESLVPRPRRCVSGEGLFTLGPTGTVRLEGAEDDVRPALDRLQAALGSGWRVRCAGADARAPDGDAAFVFRIVPQVAGPQSYRLHVAADGVYVEAQDRAGLFYAAVTFAQLAHLSEGRLPVCLIEDAPDFPVRGVMLDISRDKVPTMSTLFALVDMLAGLKINHVQLYTEHTFAYRSHEAVWRDASPMTPAEIRELDAYCAARCVELVPNQNSFGHLERWLTLPDYRDLAELPQGGAPLPWGGVHEKPTTLCPTDPRSVAFLEGLYDELLPNFTSRLFNVGCDETFDLRGEGRSRERVRQFGEGRVYLDFLRSVYSLVTARGRRMAFWGDIVIRHPELVRELPKGVVALEWGYEADHPFEAHGALFAASRVPFYVCPGTSSWNSLSGRTTNMLANMRAAAENGLRYGAEGFLITDWGDGGHWQPLAVSLAGIVYGAALAWGTRQNEGLGLAAAMDRFGGACGLGEALLKLGDAYRACGALRGNGTELFQILSKPRTRPVAAGVTAATLSSVLETVAETERVVATLDLRRSTLGEQNVTVENETRQVARLLKTACHRGLALLDGSLDEAATRRGLAREAEELMAAHAEVWRLRNREGGLRDSLERFAFLRAEYA